MTETVLVTGGAGYIGSHTCVELLEAGYEVIVVDNLCNSKEESLKRVRKITGKSLEFIKCDLLDKTMLEGVFASHEIDAVIHFAGLKAVGESVEKPLWYYENNVGGTINLCEAMQVHEVKNLVFSSSCTVYGTPETLPIREDASLGAASPYGWSKLIIEQILRDQHVADPDWNISLLRYFNPVGAHTSGEIGEDPHGIPNCLMPYITQVAVGKLEKLYVFGRDYPTRDGTGVRDYLHVVDLAKGHIKALEALAKNQGVITHNLGTGEGYTVFDVVHAFERASGVNIPYHITDRRPGDVPKVYADPSLAAAELGWKAELGLEEMCRDAWNWQKKNPDGF
jgi:UDP-glucose 4-epimerase